MFRLATAVAAIASVALSAAEKTALVIVDVQYDFASPNGSLPVTNGEAVIPVINRLRAKGKWDMIVTTQDWHPKGHISFYSRWKSDPSAQMYQPYKLPASTKWPADSIQVLWPDHCVQESDGAKFHKDLVVDKKDVVIKKGSNPDLDSYSALLENDHKTETALPKMLKDAGITKLVVVGLAEDYCVGSTAFDAKTVYKFDVTVISDATAPVAAETQVAMYAKLKTAGVGYKTSAEYLNHPAC
ncbi:hypothetical protein SPRG_17011 [Saprolegnia parasitica CBS 223.65]|uniref:nicotinamidase n=1 Tax=Saprolegnia parasitica (strain CBS 223.65) TaxID=695850 RepID=A0A067BSB6_SAPPC|nr:hypothetical protein SPRG_17011 [Saprolegnia parasitica CBS 223.65]KDO17567.1 hypothetical protein SPRG_17011 [Saprolegnia parasitica CBS 223.65]|eukprot:XP_012211724.1 hypothetical protein SPRG_17011 [Saprolegnia parasitica CBS 223.65]